jgi:16S rRNA (guanine1516-N2)-methyltransferase
VKPGICVIAGDQGEKERALAARLNCPLSRAPGTDSRFCLEYSNDRLQLRQCHPDAPGPVYVDFTQGKAAYRRRQGEGRKSPLARAVGMKPGKPPPRVLDATAGLGRDAFVLATLGCEVLMVEQSPIVHALLADGLLRARQDANLQDIMGRLSLLPGNTIEILAAMDMNTLPDSIYLDPMYPHKGKNALAKKEMRTLQLLLGPDQQGTQLLAAARQAARKRVAVKRPARAPFLGELAPDFQIQTPKTRYDIYLPSRPG